MTFGVHYYDKQGREVTGTQFYKTACEERDAQIAALQEQVQTLDKHLSEIYAAIGYSDARCEQTGDSPFDCIREIGAKAVSRHAADLWQKANDIVSQGGTKSFVTTARVAAKMADDCAAKLRAGEQP